jgi:hypothetical protein
VAECAAAAGTPDTTARVDVTAVIAGDSGAGMRSAAAVRPTVAREVTRTTTDSNRGFLSIQPVPLLDVVPPAGPAGDRLGTKIGGRSSTPAPGAKSAKAASNAPGKRVRPVTVRAYGGMVLLEKRSPVPREKGGMWRTASQPLTDRALKTTTVH